VEYRLDGRKLAGLLRELRAKGYRPRLVWMAPQDYLKRVMGPMRYVWRPSPASLGRRRLLDMAKYSRVRRAFAEGRPLPPLYLNTKGRLGDLVTPVHDGRHRAYVAFSLGIGRVPVVVA
jgi:hypothetical protein